MSKRIHKDEWQHLPQARPAVLHEHPETLAEFNAAVAAKRPVAVVTVNGVRHQLNTNWQPNWYCFSRFAMAWKKHLADKSLSATERVRLRSEYARLRDDLYTKCFKGRRMGQVVNSKELDQVTNYIRDNLRDQFD